MARQAFRVTPLRPGGEAAFSANLNKLLGDLSDLLARLEARDGHVVSYAGDVDLGGNRLRNVGRPADGRHVVTVEDARDFALYRSEEGHHVANATIVAKRGLLLADLPTDNPQGAVSLRRLINRLSTGQVSDHVARTIIRIAGVDVGARRALNFITGVTAVDDPTNEEVELTVTGGGGTSAPAYESFDGPLTSVTLAGAPAMEIATVNGVDLERGVEYAVVANVLTPTRALGAGEWIGVSYWTAGGPLFESFAGPAATFTLSNPATTAIVEVNGVGLRKVVAAPTAEDFTLAGTLVTLGRAIGATERAWVYYWL